MYNSSIPLSRWRQSHCSRVHLLNLLIRSLSFQKPRWWQLIALDSVSTTTTHVSYSQMGTLLLLHFHFLFRISPENQHQWLWVPERKIRKKIPIALFPNPMRSRVSSPKPCSLKRSLFYTYPRFVFLFPSQFNVIFSVGANFYGFGFVYKIPFWRFVHLIEESVPHNLEHVIVYDTSYCIL